ncbi:MAG: hypothetical protein JO210_03075 [Acidobacteriaceae bacterium]|nr:hypothetical protein [Acidobacteriaceae bacterium]
MTIFDALGSARWFAGLALSIAIAAPSLHAQGNDDFDIYKIRLSGFWFYSNPSGDFQGSGDTDRINIQKDLSFSSYSTFTGKLDWKFTRKNHFYLLGSSFNQSRQTVLTSVITFRGETYNVGVSTHAQLSAPLIAPGYQYDIIRRKRGHLGIGVQIDLFNASASLTAAAQVTGTGTQQNAVSGKESLLAPIPVAGPEFRLYLTNSPRLFVEGQVYGMYLFGYGNFVSTADNIGVTLVKHLSLNAGYQLGSRLVVNNKASSDRFGLRLTQKGPIAGLEWSF